MQTLKIDAANKVAPTRTPEHHPPPSSLSAPKDSKVHPADVSWSTENNATLRFIGTATTILEWEGLRLMTDPNFLHEGDHVHLGPGVTGTRRTNPAIDLHQLPPIDVVLLSHYHADHFDELVEDSLRRDLPIISTPHAKSHLANKQPASESFTSVTALDFWEEALLQFPRPVTTTDGQKEPRVKVTGMPGKHVPDGILNVANELLKAVPPTNGWMLELGYAGSSSADDEFQCGYRIYISGDTLLVSDLKKIPAMYTHAGKPIDLMLVHLGGTTIPGPSIPLLMVTMDAKQGIELVKLIQPGLTIPVHYDDYDVFLSPLDDFKAEVEKAGLQEKTVYLQRGDEFAFSVRHETRKSIEGV